MTLKRAIPSWVVGLVIIVTAILTLIAVVKTQSAVSWTPQGAPESPKSFGQIFFPGISAIQQSWASGQSVPAANSAAPSRVPTIVAGSVPGHTNRGTCTGCHNIVTSRGAAMATIQLGSRPPHDDRGLCTNCHVVATVQPAIAKAAIAADATKGGATRVPTIVAGAVPPHAERGTCTTCHEVVSSRGIPVPSIQVHSRRPHDTRGLCTNCHDIAGAAAPAALAQAGANPAALTMVANAMPMAQPALALALPTAQPAAPAPEGGWNGIEVTPVTTLTATQYGIPHGTVGLIVAEAEGGAAVAGVKAGDVILGINGTPTPTLSDFFRATANGTVARGSVDILRKGQAMAVVVDAAATVAKVVPAPQTAPTAVAQTVAAAMATPAAAAPVPPEGEWLGLEVAPISSLTTTQYNLPPGLVGLIIVEAEAQAATIGVKAGDVLQYVNGVPTTDITKFFLATKNGTLSRGTIVLWRKGEQMVNVLGQTVAAPATAPAAQMTTPVQMPLNPMAYGQPAWSGAVPLGVPVTPVGNVGQGAGQGTQVPCYRQF